MVLCRELGLFEQALVAIDGSKFKAVNNRDKNFTPHKLKARQRQLEESIAPCLADLDRADRDPSLVPEVRTEHLKEKLATVRAQMKKLEAIGRQLAVAPDEQVSMTDPDARSMATSGRFDKRDFKYEARRDRYRCPADQYATWRFTSVEKGMAIHK